MHVLWSCSPMGLNSNRGSTETIITFQGFTRESLLWWRSIKETWYFWRLLMALGPTWRNGWYVYLLWGRWRCLYICIFWVLLISRSNTVPVRETDICVGLFSFVIEGRRSVIGVSGVTYWRTRVFVRKYPCSNCCNIRLDVVYELIKFMPVWVLCGFLCLH